MKWIPLLSWMKLCLECNGSGDHSHGSRITFPASFQVECQFTTVLDKRDNMPPWHRSIVEQHDSGSPVDHGMYCKVHGICSNSLRFFRPTEITGGCSVPVSGSLGRIDFPRIAIAIGIPSTMSMWQRRVPLELRFGQLCCGVMLFTKQAFVSPDISTVTN